MKKARMNPMLNIILTFLIVFFLMTNQALSDHVSNCTEDCDSNTVWVPANTSALIDSASGCMYDVSYRWRKCYNTQTGNYLTEVEILSFTLQTGNCSSLTDENLIMSKAAKEVIADASILSGNSLGYSPYYMSLKTFACWKKIFVNDSIVSCNEDECCKSYYTLNYIHDYNDVYVSEQSPENLNPPDSCLAVPMPCPIVCNSLVMPEGVPIITGEWPSCTEECYWTLQGNGYTNLNNFLGTRHEMPLIFKTFNQERMRINEEGNVVIGHEDDYGTYLQPIGKLDINLGGWNSQSSKISFGLNGSHAPSIHFYNPFDSPEPGFRNAGNFRLEHEWLSDPYQFSLSFKADPGFLSPRLYPEIGNEIPKTLMRIMEYGNVGIGEDLVPQAKLHVKKGAVIFEEILREFDGTINEDIQLSQDDKDKINNLGHGCRFMWIPGKHALRMGRLDYSPFDNSYHQAWNYDSCGNSSTALGHNVRAKAHGSTVFGAYSTVDVDGAFSHIIGNYSSITAPSSFSMGTKNSIHGISLNNGNSFAIGNNLKVLAKYSTALGNDMKIMEEHEGSFVIGDFYWAGGVFSKFTNSTSKNQFTARFTGGQSSETGLAKNAAFRLITKVAFYDGTPANGAYLFNDGTNWYVNSDSSLKDIVDTVINENILSKITTVPLYYWKFKADSLRVNDSLTIWDEPSTIFIGPTAQGFNSVFTEGVEDSCLLSSAMVMNVAFAGVQGLIIRTDDLRNDIDNNTWSTSGNSGTITKYLGTNNEMPLTFKTDSEERGLFTNDGAFLLNSETGTSNITGTGQRLMWLPTKSAFRAGYALLNEWDNDSIGDYSTAIGYNVDASGDNSTAFGNNVSTNNKSGSFVIGDNAILPNTTFSSANNQLTMRFCGNSSSTLTNDAAYRFFTNATLTEGVYLAPGESGWRTVSDKNKKNKIVEVKDYDILEAISKVPVYSWEYKDSEKGYTYISPMAQDFTGVFNYGNLDTNSINSMVMDGVLFSSVRALSQNDISFDERLQKIEEKLDSGIIQQDGGKKEIIQNSVDKLSEDNENLKKENTELKLRLDILEEKINKILESNSNIIDCYQDIKLEQNIPNPFDGTTEISYFIPERYGKIINLIINDATGMKAIKKIKITSGITANIQISAKDFETGAYIYGIEIDGKMVKSKKMIIIK